MACERNSIGDGWEDVADDNLSVISLPASEGKEHVTGSTTRTLQDPVLADVTIKDTIAPRFLNKVATQPGEKGEGQHTVTGSKLEDGHGHECLYTSETPSAIEAGSTSGDASKYLHLDRRGCEEDAVAPSENATPDDFLRNHNFLSKVLDDTIHFINNLTTLHPSIADETFAVCLSLATQVAELKPILVAYARTCFSTTIETPLDPGLFTWLSEVQVTASAFRSELQDKVKRTAPGTVDPPFMSHTLRDILDVLKTHEQQMEAFLPIIQVYVLSMLLRPYPRRYSRDHFVTLYPSRVLPLTVTYAKIRDFNEFQTCRMNIPTSRLEPAYRPTVTYTSSATRSATYRLRDEIQRASKSILQASQCSLLDPASEMAAAMAQQYSRLFVTISTMLSNHGSEWIDHALSGGMTHMEFVQLDAMEVTEYADNLRHAVDNLDGLRLQWREACARGTGADDQRQAIFSAHGNSALEQLDMLMQVLSATFRVAIE